MSMDHYNISAREKQVLDLIVAGKCSKEIAKSLFISPKTVASHRCHLMKKLDVHNVAGLVKKALIHIPAPGWQCPVCGAV